GAAIMDPLVASGAMPDWSPDGTKLVYSQPGVAPPCFGGGLCGATAVDQGELQVLTFDGANWSSPSSLVPYGGQNNYYPSFSPDGSFVLFNRSPGDLNSYDAPD